MIKRILKIILIVVIAVILLGGIGLYALMGGFYRLKDYSETHETLTEVVSLKNGNIQGYMDENCSGVEVYKGIPYAKPPVGNLRWKAPQPVESWDGVLDCTRWSSSAIQEKPVPFLNYTEEFIITNNKRSEDCLYLNVWTTTKARENAKALPVIVFIHGGGYSGGGSSCEIYEGQEIAGKGAVFVSINYRLGILGYLATTELCKEDPAAGNYGLMDQIQALEWVKDNIAVFGGDPNNVTIMGQSAGGQAVQSLIVSPKANGLFRHAVVMSSNAATRAAYTTQEDRIRQGDKAIKGKSLAALREMSPEDLMKLDYNDLGPCVDDVFITGSYSECVAAGLANDVDILFGMTDNPKTPFWSTQTDSSFYGQYTSGSISTTEDLMIGLYEQVLLREKAGTYSGNIYFYNFSHMMPMTERYWGTTHTSDVPYMLNIFSDYRKDYWTEADYALGNLMSDYLTAFAKNGAMPEEWGKVTTACCYMNFDTLSEMKSVTQVQMEEYWAALEVNHE